MVKPLVENEFAEIAVGNYQNAFLSPCNGEDICIHKAMRVVARDCGSIRPRPRRWGMSRKSALWSNRNFIAR
jgi:hypothetical protein